jgi:hypothetical protein
MGEKGIKGGSQWQWFGPRQGSVGELMSPTTSLVAIPSEADGLWYMVKLF